MKTCLISILSILFASGTLCYGQVTIGANEEPLPGAILDLKQVKKDDDSENSTKGLMLPRVNLVNLKPTASTGPNSLPASIGSDASKDWDLLAHTGLAVYNVKDDQCANIKVGVYTWSGSEWQPLFPGAAGAALAPGVMLHPAKPNPLYIDEATTPNEPVNIYEEFYSAEFGAAGRWMTTNLAAWAYDWPNGTPPTLGGVDASNSTTEPRWCYPKATGTVTAGETAPSTWYSKQGLLYNWPAATGKQNSSTSNQGNTDHAAVQGICPDGWHLPSDKEWSELETAISGDYTAYATGIPSGAGQAMKSPCGTTATYPNGLSKNPAQNGFSAQLAGDAYGGSTANFGDYAYFWSSGSFNSSYAWSRTLNYSLATVYRAIGSRYTLFSVRCKKD